MHGIGAWFDAFFIGPQKSVTLSTAPTQPATHWSQMRFLLKEPLTVSRGELITGEINLIANKEQSYEMKLAVNIPAINVSQTADYYIKDPDFRWGHVVQQIMAIRNFRNQLLNQSHN